MAFSTVGRFPEYRKQYCGRFMVNLELSMLSDFLNKLPNKKGELKGTNIQIIIFVPLKILNKQKQGAVKLFEIF